MKLQTHIRHWEPSKNLKMFSNCQNARQNRRTNQFISQKKERKQSELINLCSSDAFKNRTSFLLEKDLSIVKLALKSFSHILLDQKQESTH